MTRLAIAALVLSTGCIVYEDGAPGPVNRAPFVYDGEAGCYWDNYFADDVWYFEAEADDPDGVLDVVEVYADVWDERTGDWVDSFELFPTRDPYYWWSDWLGSTTWLVCGYDGYLVDLVAYDSFGAYDILTVVPTVDGH